MAPTVLLDLTDGFSEARLPPIPDGDALKRVTSICTNPDSGWLSYDLCGVHARMSGLFELITPWSLL